MRVTRTHCGLTERIAEYRKSPADHASFATAARARWPPGLPFISDAQLSSALSDAGVDQADSDAIAAINATALLEALQVAFALAGRIEIGALFFTRRIPDTAPGQPTPSGQGVAPPPQD